MFRLTPTGSSGFVEEEELMWDLITDNDSVEGRLVTTMAIVVIAVAAAAVAGRLLSRCTRDRHHKYYARRR